jgi:hypothetical protein
MIKPRDFRIGNLLLFDDDGVWKVEEVEAIGKDSHGFKGLYVDFGWAKSTLEDLYGDGDLNVKGIPLTEEWLDRFGFKKHQSGDYITWQHDLDGVGLVMYNGREKPNRLTIDKTAFDGDEELGFYIEFYYCYVPVKYVHTLQNIFFYFAGEELTLKEKVV